MTVATRKQRELKARESLILDQAHLLLEEKGYLGLNLDELAERIEYAKGTIYLHFSTKEDLLLGVVVRLSQERAALFRQATRFPGLTRERCAAVGIADLLLKERRPHAFQLMQLVHTSSVWEKTSPARRRSMHQTLLDAMEPVVGLVREAILAGDILRRDLTPEQIVLGLFSMSKGAMLIESNSGDFGGGWAAFVTETLQFVRHVFCDGVGWTPLYADHDYPSVEKNIREDYFRDALAD